MGNLYSEESIKTLVTFSENHRNDTVIILAGYTDRIDALKAYRNIAKRVQGEEVEFLTFSTNDTFLTRLKKLFTGK